MCNKEAHIYCEKKGSDVIIMYIFQCFFFQIECGWPHSTFVCQCAYIDKSDGNKISRKLAPVRVPALPFLSVPHIIFFLSVMSNFMESLWNANTLFSKNLNT